MIGNIAIRRYFGRYPPLERLALMMLDRKGSGNTLAMTGNT